MNYFKFFIFVFVLIQVNDVHSQYSQFNITGKPGLGPLPYVCDLIRPEYRNMLNAYSGRSKPERTDVPGVPSDAYFPVLIVFVQFKNDIGPESVDWPRGQAPVYLKNMIANIKKYPVNGNWWDTYSEQDEILSDYWMEQSRGKFHVVGKAYSVVLDNEYSFYINNGGVQRVNDDIYAKLKTYDINWQDYDRWSASRDSANLFNYYPDGFVDMLYKIHRSRAPQIGMPNGGIAFLFNSHAQGGTYVIDEVNDIKINGGFGLLGSGIFLTPGHSGNEGDSSYASNPPMQLLGTISFSVHEFGHYLFGASHGSYGKMSGDGAHFGPDESFSPFESSFLGYSIPVLVDYNGSDYNLGDYSARNSNSFGEVLQVPISGANEFFLIASRRKVSSYDRIMWGDTAKSFPYRSINPEYGKGVYIYHVTNGMNYPSFIDQECADGLYKWSFQGFQHPDWSNEQLVEYYARGDVTYDNDASSGNINAADGKSVIAWFGFGKKNESLNSDGTDRTFTNLNEVWTSRELQGDRWDPWNTGYNEMFSPYSSPSTRGWDNINTGIFIWYDSLFENGTSHFKIFRAGLGGLTEDDILSITPPSRPMGLKVSFSDCDNNFIYPKLTWLHNSEPDMKSAAVPGYETKKYNVYRAVSNNRTSLPVNYEFVAACYSNENTKPEFIDYKMPLSCTLNDKDFNVRYKITAADMYNDESVKSDFAGFSLVQQQLNVDNYNQKGNPFKYFLSQNYPNPFNPETNISYSIGADGHVSIKVFNILGEEIAVLINEYKKRGDYNVHFNAENLPSGIYIYRIETAFYTVSKKMVLIK